MGKELKDTWPANVVSTAIREQLESKFVPSSLKIRLPDENYTLLSPEKAKDVLVRSNVNFVKRARTLLDCDDFAFLSKADFCMEAYKLNLKAPYAYGIVWGKLPTPHAMNIFVTDKLVVKLAEPQTNEIKDIGDWIKEIWLLIF